MGTNFSKTSHREVAQRDVDRERRLRCESEARLRSSLSEADRCRSRLAALQKEFTRMEDTVRSMLQYKSKYELLKHEKASLTLAFESKVQQFQSALNKLSHENEQLKKQLRTFEAAGGGKVVERLQELERDNSVLSQEGEVQRRQYERCLDDVANQVVRALLAQKGLREEIGSLHRRIKELETQNRALSSVLIQQLQGATPVTPCSLLASSQDKPTKATVTLALPSGGHGRSRGGGRPLSCDEARLRGALRRGDAEDVARGGALVWLPIQRPRSLNLADSSCCQYRAHRSNATNVASRPPLLTSPLTGGGNIVKKSGGEDEGSESPESGNRDEGYSTMSSDVQGPLEAPRRGLEDLKEATDETESATLPPPTIDHSTSPADRMLDVPETSELVLIPLSVAVAANSRHSFPPVEDLLPFQHIMRSFSDSHLCLKLTPNSPSPSYSLTSAESLFLFGDKQPLRRSRATTSLLCTAVQEEEDDSGSWSSVDNWDTDYIQHWLRLDETRSQLQQQMEYDAAELEDWTMEETEFWKRCEAITPNQSHLPSIQETNASELEEDANECLWNGSSYLTDGNELMGRCLWPTSARCLISPGGDSWSSVGTNSEDSKSCNDNCQNGSKRSSTAMSTDSGESPAVGTDFTRDFYRLVKFESTKSLASTSSRSDANVGLKRADLSFSSDREQALQSVLHFIAEQQQYCLSREVQDHPSDVSLDVSPVKNNAINDENENRSNELVEGLMFAEDTLESKVKPNECCDTTKALPESSTNVEEDVEEGKVDLREDVDLKKPTLVSEDFSNDGINDCLDLRHKDVEPSAMTNGVNNCDVNSCRLGTKQQILPNDTSCSVSDSNSNRKSGSEMVEASKEVQKEVKTRDSLLEQPSLIPRLIRPDLIANKPMFLGPVPEEDEDHCSVSTNDSAPKSPKSPEPKRSLIPKSTAQLPKSPEPKRVFRRPLEPTSISDPGSEGSVLVGDSNELGFHERASSKDVIDELNRMIRKGEDAEVETSSTVTNLDMGCCCPTGWVHVERDIDFTDPKARANLLDVMLAASHSSSSSEDEGCRGGGGGGNSSDSEAEEQPPGYQHLHRIHRFRRQKKASANREPLGALRCPASAPRPSIIGRDDFFVRYGEKEREAVASFDFLEELSTTSISGASSCDNNGPPGAPSLGGDSPPLSQTPDPDAPENLSLSDSCAGSYSGSELSLENH
ncbi:uncharacterized protein LOC111062079 isoform X2 [Nilaparvata lugens]|uniref:uncharacterized protein LOC111062079 isoform X2 n=1 Tax=Nilaparvata lugens TaxID=108931 RepID=UPI00193DCCD6|nr:uncharacterized protein LOC111062079 isoform X2 [Nilaparvata lugens]